MHRNIQPRHCQTVADAYRWFRSQGEPAHFAIQSARTAVRFFEIGCWSDHDPNALVRLEYEPEIDAYDFGDVNEKQRKETERLIEREGCWILCAQIRETTEDAWETVDSIGMMIGIEYSGYEPQLMLAALDAHDAQVQTHADTLAERATNA